MADKIMDTSLNPWAAVIGVFYSMGLGYLATMKAWPAVIAISVYGLALAVGHLSALLSGIERKVK